MNQASYAERRVSRRVPVREVTQFDLEGRRVVGLLLLINHAGVFVNSHHLADVGDTLDLEFDLPGNLRFLKAQGEVVHKNHPPTYDSRQPIGMGIRFVGMDDLTRKLIGDFLES